MANCTPPQVNDVVYYGELGVYYDATVTAVVSGNRVDLNVSGLGTRTSVDYSSCINELHWTCHHGTHITCSSAQWVFGSDIGIKVPA